MKQKTVISSGPLALSANRRYFLDNMGTPCFWQGDTQWELLRMFSAQDARAVVERRIAQGFNVFQIMLNGVPDGNQGLSGERPWIDNNPPAVNEPYFTKVDSIINFCDELGLTFVIGVYHKSEAAFFTPQSARKYARYVAKRYAGIRNIIWCMYPAANEAFTEICVEIAAGLAEGDGGKHLITVHPDPPPASSSWIHAENWLAFNTLQTYNSTLENFNMVSADYKRAPVKPVVNGEARYETSDGTSPLDIRRGAIWSLLAGGFYSYGHTKNWESPATWEKWIDSPGANHMAIIGNFFRSLQWWELAPDRTIIAGGAGDMAAARASDNSWALVYLPAPGSVDIRISTLKNAAKAQWFNPATGEKKNAAGGSLTTPKGWEDALLLVAP
ncbi:MAG: DUF4038 domain-containing protein [Chitinivibrionales bacterium]|nr:DUF4038 domain-containing protein [Chitinivibrionales bacterium]